MSKSGKCEVCEKRTTRRQWDDEQQEFYFIHEKCERWGDVLTMILMPYAWLLLMSNAQAFMKESAQAGHAFSELVKQASGNGG